MSGEVVLPLAANERTAQQSAPISHLRYLSRDYHIW